jgi:hypothetical protein
LGWINVHENYGSERHAARDPQYNSSTLGVASQLLKKRVQHARIKRLNSVFRVPETLPLLYASTRSYQPA